MTLRQAAVRLAVLAVATGGAAWFTVSRQPLHHPPGILVACDPEQADLAAPGAPFQSAGWTLKPVAEYVIEARVLGRKRYTRDATATLSPWDLALGWGRMSDEAILERLDISQRDRFYHWQYWGGAPLPEADIIRLSANVHVIPADAAIGARIADLRVGELVRLEGWLVEATHSEADRPWRSSLSRDDEGEGACEILYVRSVTGIAPRR